MFLGVLGEWRGGGVVFCGLLRCYGNKRFYTENLSGFRPESGILETGRCKWRQIFIPEKSPMRLTLDPKKSNSPKSNLKKSLLSAKKFLSL